MSTYDILDLIDKDPYFAEKFDIWLYKLGHKTPPFKRTYQHEDSEIKMDEKLKNLGWKNYYPLIPEEPSDGHHPLVPVEPSDGHQKHLDKEFTDNCRVILFKHNISEVRAILQHRGFGRFIDAEYFDYLFCDTNITRITFREGQLLGVYNIHKCEYSSEKLKNQVELLKAGLYTNVLYLITFLRYIPGNVWNAIPFELSLKIAMYLPPPFRIITNP